jgi:hypothetical protein
MDGPAACGEVGPVLTRDPGAGAFNVLDWIEFSPAACSTRLRRAPTGRRLTGAGTRCADDGTLAFHYYIAHVLRGEIRGLGNRLRHDYDTIDLSRVWLLIERDMPS